MKRIQTFVLAMTAGAALVAGPLAAAGGSSAPVPETPEQTPEQIAIEEYNAGLGLRDKAMEADDKARDESDPRKRAKLEDKRDQAFAKAVARFEGAVENKPDFAQAHGSLGYALRRLGRYEEAMEAYDTALSIDPNYPEAMEYRAEALLGLGRLTEAQEAYQRLSMMDAALASQLLEAVKAWADDEANAESAAAADLADWIAARESAAAATSSGASGAASSWR